MSRPKFQGAEAEIWAMLKSKGLQTVAIKFSDGTVIRVSKLEELTFNAFRLLIIAAGIDPQALETICVLSKLYNKLCQESQFLVSIPKPGGESKMLFTFLGMRELGDYSRAYQQYKEDLSVDTFELMERLLIAQAYALYDRLKLTLRTNTLGKPTPLEVLPALLQNGTLNAWNRYKGDKYVAIFRKKLRHFSTLEETNAVFKNEKEAIFWIEKKPSILNILRTSLVKGHSMELFLARRQELMELAEMDYVNLIFKVLYYQRSKIWWDYLEFLVDSAILIEIQGQYTATFKFPEMRYCISKLSESSQDIAMRLFAQLMGLEDFDRMWATVPEKPDFVHEPDDHPDF